MVEAMDISCANCSSTANMKCPKCRDLGLPACVSSFCSQDCFKSSWGTHKKLHKPSENSYMFVAQSGRERLLDMPNWGWTGTLRPARVAPKRVVPDSVVKPDWGTTGVPVQEMNSPHQNSAPVRNSAQIEKFSAACKLGRLIVDEAHRHIKPGVTTDEIDRIVHDFTVEHGAYPSPLHYHHFPKSVCTSVNEVICHGIPDMRELESGDIVNVDVSCLIDGFHGDLNETFIVGEVDDASKKLIKVAHDCLQKAIAIVKPGVRYREVGAVISAHAKDNGFSVVRTYCGHGIGEQFHCAPNVPHFAGNKAKGVMQVGHTFTIEPMINAGSYRDRTWPDGWTSVTEDGCRSAQFEHGMVVTATGCDVLTRRLEVSPPLWWEVEE